MSVYQTAIIKYFLLLQLRASIINLLGRRTVQTTQIENVCSECSETRTIAKLCSTSNPKAYPDCCCLDACSSGMHIEQKKVKRHSTSTTHMTMPLLQRISQSLYQRK